MKRSKWLISTLGILALFLFAGKALAGGDADGDGVADSVDNCSQLANLDQRDTNGDGFGNVCDPDLDNNNIVNVIDLGLFKSVFFTGDADADFDGNGVVNVVDLGTLKVFFFGPPGPGATAPPTTYTTDVQPILNDKCAPCHTGLGVGGHDVGVSYADALQPATDNDCTGLVIGECSLVLIQAGDMPQGAGCTGDPAQDVGNASCLTQAQQDIMQAWIDAGLPE